MRYEPKYIINYILSYNTGIPCGVVIGISLFILVIVLYLYLTKRSFLSFVRKSSLIILIGYVFLVLCTTIIYRPKSTEQPGPVFTLWYNWPYYKRLSQIILNIIMFIPIGFLSGLATGGKITMRVIAIGCAFSFIIEYLQLVTYRGVCNINDILHNIIGCCLGYGLFLIIYAMSGKLLTTKDKNLI